MRPLRPGHEPGTWRAPSALIEAGLLSAINTNEIIELPRPIYSAEPQSGTHLLNGHTIRSFNLTLADAVRDAINQNHFALVIGGDRSILLGALAGARHSGSLSLIHIDGHSDFRHPGNYDQELNVGAVAGMDLALATGRGEATATQWPAISYPLVEDCQVVQLEERENRNIDFDWPDVNDTSINRIDVFEAIKIGPMAIIEHINKTLNQKTNQNFWIHFDVDVLDQAIMPAVDCPGSPGITPEHLIKIMSAFVADPRCLGMTVSVFDPDLDPDGQFAATIVTILEQLPFRR